MKAKHLRIGNIVTINNDSWAEFKGVPLVVTGIAVKMDTYNDFPKSTGSVNAETLDKKNDFAQFDEFIEPIPLTEDWLLKFGFRKRKACGNYWFEKKIKGILFLTNDINSKIGFAFSVKLEHVFIHDIDDAVKFKYVHSLQNIVFALTRTELELK